MNHANMPKSLVTMSKMAYFIPRIATKTAVAKTNAAE